MTQNTVGVDVLKDQLDAHRLADGGASFVKINSLQARRFVEAIETRAKSSRQDRPR